MGEVADYKVAGILPNTLQTMLNVLILENGLRSWQIYDDKFGVSVRVRFGSDSQPSSSVTCPDSSLNIHAKPFHSTTKHTPASYTKKPPAQYRRENARKIMKATRPLKRQRTIDEHLTPIEQERASDMITTDVSMCESPMICCDRLENDIWVAPVSPIQIELNTQRSCSLMYGTNLVSSPVADLSGKTDDVLVKCPCCGEEMEDASHMCSLDASSDSSDTVSDFEKERNGSTVVRNVPQKVKANDILNRSYYTYCFLGQNTSTTSHSGAEYYQCKSCCLYVCYTCFSRYFRTNNPGPKCCQNADIPDIKYDRELKPK